MKENFKRKEPEKKDKVVKPSDLKFFIGMCKANKKKIILQDPPSDYNRSIIRSFEKRTSGSSSNVPHLGAQKKQSIEPLVMLPTEQQGLIRYLQTSKLMTAEVAVSKEILYAEVTRWKYEEGKSLVLSEVVPALPTQMQWLHDYYMHAMLNCNFMQGTKFTYEDFFRGEGIIWLNWEEVYQLYHQDALDISIIGLWVL